MTAVGVQDIGEVRGPIDGLDCPAWCASHYTDLDGSIVTDVHCATVSDLGVGLVREAGADVVSLGAAAETLTIDEARRLAAELLAAVQLAGRQ